LVIFQSGNYEPDVTSKGRREAKVLEQKRQNGVDDKNGDRKVTEVSRVMTKAVDDDHNVEQR
jgi:hypothetical protein